MKASIKSIHAMKGTLLIRTLFACLLVVAFSFAAIPTRAGDAEDKAKKAFADWKAAKEAVATAKEKLADAQKALQNAMTAVAKSGGKTTAEQEAALAKGREAVAAAEAALREAEKQELAARIALENAIAELPDGPLKDQLKRERNFPSLVTANGLYTVKFDTPSGQLTVNLPDDMRAGDTISGTVVAEPRGQTAEQRATNMAVLTGYVIEIETPRKPDGTSNPKVKAQVTAAPSPFTFTLPPSITPTPTLTNVSSASSSGLGISLTNTSGSFAIGGTTTVPIELISLSLQSVAPLNTFQLPTIAQQGKPVEINSGNRNFDGNSTNTNCTVAGQPVVILAESPRKVVFESPINVTGPVEIVLKEGNQETKGTYRDVGVNLTAPKTSLLKGESTELHVEVIGLQGLTQPVPLTLESHGVITMEGGMYQPLVIHPSQVGADGRYSTTRGITGVQTGGWTATATVMTHRFDFCLQDDSVPARVILVNSFSGDYIFAPPGGTTLSGNGTVTRKGCIITLTDSLPDRRVQGNIDPCAHTGSASVQTVSPKVKFTITDRNTTDNTCSCGPGCK